MTHKEMIMKAKEAKTPEELLKMAHDAGLTEFSEESAKTYFDVLNQTGEMADEELDVSGGGCAVRAHDQKMVSALNFCKHYRCNICHTGSNSLKRKEKYLPDKEIFYACNRDANHVNRCDTCYYCSYEKGAWWCNNDVHFFE